VYGDDIDRVWDEEAPQGQGVGVGGDGGDVGGSDVSNMGGLDVPKSFRDVHSSYD